MRNMPRQGQADSHDPTESLSPLRVGLNAHLLSMRSSYRGAGLSRYVHQLLTHLPGADPDMEFHAYMHDQEFAPRGWRLHRTQLPTDGPWGRILWEQLLQPLSLKAHKTQVVHGPVYVAPLVSPCPRVITVHDLSFVRCPEHLPSPNRQYLRLLTRLSARRASRIIVVSANTKRELLQWLGLDPELVEVIHHGVADDYQPIRNNGRVAAFRERHGLPDKMILFVGTLEPRKNVETLIRAYARLRRRHAIPHVLVIGGAKGWDYDRIFSVAEELSLSGQVIFPGFLPRGELPLWYNATDLFVYPSVYEGFGWPPLEAMACGAPVVTSSASSLPEVVGEGALTVDPHNVEGLANAMYDVLSSDSTRERLSEAGMKRATRFTWERTANATARVYRQAVTLGNVDDSY